MPRTHTILTPTVIRQTVTAALRGSPTSLGGRPVIARLPASGTTLPRTQFAAMLRLPSGDYHTGDTVCLYGPDGDPAPQVVVRIVTMQVGTDAAGFCTALVVAAGAP